MGRKLFVGNLPYSVDNALLGQAFGAHGELISASVVLDRETQRSRGFAFVEFVTEDAARIALQALDGSLMNGRNITVREAEERMRPPMGEARGRPMEMRSPPIEMRSHSMARRPSFENPPVPSAGPAEDPATAPRAPKRSNDDRRRRHDDWDDE